MTKPFKIFLGITAGLLIVAAGSFVVLQPEIVYYTPPGTCSLGYCTRQCPVKTLEFKGVNKSIELSRAC